MILEKKAEFTILIGPKRFQMEYLKDLFRYRELLYFLAWRDTIVRYKQAILGVAWAVIKPLLTMAVFAFVFGRVAGLSSGGVNYSLFVLVGLLPWLFFSTSVTDSSFCLVNNIHLVSKVYFPRVILLASHLLVNLVDFMIGLGMMLVLLFFSGYLSWTILYLPFFVFMTLLLCFAAGLWLAALNVRYRDLRFIVQFAVQFGMFISPIGYGTAEVPEEWRWAYFLNPIAAIIEGFRWAVFGIAAPDLFYGLLSSLGVIILLFTTGYLYFRSVERTIVDVI